MTALLLAAGLLVLHRVLRPRFDARLSALTLLLIAAGTFAFDLLLQANVGAAAAFALAAVALLVYGSGERPAAFAALITGAAALGLARGSGFPLGPWQPALTLFGSRQGLLHLTPVLWVGVCGIVLQARRDGRSAMTPALAAAALVSLHAACRAADGAPCPRESLSPLLALLAVPVAEALRALRALVRRCPLAPLTAAGALLVCWNLLFMQQYALDMIPRDYPVAFADVAGNAAALVARRMGSPLSWPANWVFAARYHVGPERFDAAAGKALPRAADGSLALDVGARDDEALLLEGWSVRHPCGASVCRAVESGARVLLPVERPGAPMEVIVRAATGDTTFRVPTGGGTMRALALPVSAGTLVDEIRVRAAEGP